MCRVFSVSLELSLESRKSFRRKAGIARSPAEYLLQGSVPKGAFYRVDPQTQTSSTAPKNEPLRPGSPMESQRHLPALLQKSFGTPGRFGRQVRENPLETCLKGTALELIVESLRLEERS